VTPRTTQRIERGFAYDSPRRLLMPAITCLFCDHANPAGAKYCNECGSALHLKPCDRVAKPSGGIACSFSCRCRPRNAAKSRGGASANVSFSTRSSGYSSPRSTRRKKSATKKKSKRTQSKKLVPYQATQF